MNSEMNVFSGEPESNQFFDYELNDLSLTPSAIGEEEVFQPAADSPTEEIPISEEQNMKELALITNRLIDTYHTYGQKVISCLKLTYFGKFENCCEEISFPISLLDPIVSNSQVSHSFQALLNASGTCDVNGMRVIPANRVPRIEGIEDVMHEILEEVRLTLFPHEPQILAKVLAFSN